MEGTERRRLAGIGAACRIQLKNNFQKGIHAMLLAPKEKGQGLVEYAIILALVALVVIAVMRILGPKIGNTFSSINASMDTF